MNKEGIIKHKEVFDAWLNGAEIQYKVGLGWTDVEHEPNWSQYLDYRVKPKMLEVIAYRRYVFFNGSEFHASTMSNSLHGIFKSLEDKVSSYEADSSFVKWIDNEWITTTIEI